MTHHFQIIRPCGVTEQVIGPQTKMVRYVWRVQLLNEGEKKQLNFLVNNVRGC